MSNTLRSYLSFFRLRFQSGLQYRAAAAAGVSTQFAWGVMEIMLYTAFHRGAAGQFPMELQALCSYIWLRQAFLTCFSIWMVEGDLFDLISSGNVAYELCRPMDLYGMWFTKAAAGRLSRAALRSLPILAVAFLLPKPYGLSLPAGPAAFLLFLPTVAMAFLLVVAASMIMYIACFYTISSLGVRIIANAVVEFLSGAWIPLPFLPEGFRQAAELLPFSLMLSLPLRVYGGDIPPAEAAWGLLLQVVWLAAFLLLGKWMMSRALRRVVVQGG